MSRSVINGCFDKVLEEIAEQHQATGSGRVLLADDQTKVLWSLFGQKFFDALELIDRNKVTLLNSPSGRQLIQVEHRDDNQNAPLLVLSTVNFCSCEHFKFQGLARGDLFFCKHLIASRLSLALGCNKQENVSDDGIRMIIRQNFQ